MISKPSSRPDSDTPSVEVGAMPIMPSSGERWRISGGWSRRLPIWEGHRKGKPNPKRKGDGCVSVEWQQEDMEGKVEGEEG